MNEKKFENIILYILEGIDGSGKSSTLEIIKRKVMEKKLENKFLFLKEPTELESGKKIRQYLQEKKRISKEEWVSLFKEDRYQNMKTYMLPNKDKIILMDRYYFSTAAYQGENHQDVLSIFYDFQKAFPNPKKVFYLFTEPQIALKRIQKRSFAFDIFEKKEELERIQRNYLFLFYTTYKNVIFLDSDSNSLEEMAEYILNRIFEMERIQKS